MPDEQETVNVSGVRCERCVAAIASALREVHGLAGASATLTGEVTLHFQDRSVRDAAVAAIERAGFSVGP